MPPLGELNSTSEAKQHFSQPLVFLHACPMLCCFVLMDCDHFPNLSTRFHGFSACAVLNGNLSAVNKCIAVAWIPTRNSAFLNLEVTWNPDGLFAELCKHLRRQHYRLRSLNGDPWLPGRTELNVLRVISELYQ